MEMKKSVIKNVLLSVFFAIFMLASLGSLAFSTLLPKKTVFAATEWNESWTFEMEDGVSLKIGEKNGLRFIVKMDEEAYNYVQDENVELGFVIAPEQLMKQADGDYLNMPKKIGGAIDKNKIYADGGYWYANGCISDMKLQNFKYNFVAVAYVKEADGDVFYAEYNDQARNNLYDTVNLAALYGYAEDIFKENAGGYAKVDDENGWFGSKEFPIVVESSEEYTALVDIANEQGIDLSTFHVVVKNNATPMYGFNNSEYKPASIISGALHTVNTLIQGLPDGITMPDAIGQVAKIHDIAEQHDALSDADKASVDNYAKLESLLAVVEGFDRVYMHSTEDNTVIPSYSPGEGYSSAVGGSATIKQDKVYGNVLSVVSDADGRAALHFKNFPNVSNYERIYFYVKVSESCDIYLSDGIANDGWGQNWKNTWSTGGFWCNANTWRLIEIDPVNDGYIGADFAIAFRTAVAGISFEISDIYGVQKGVLKTVKYPFGSATFSGESNEYGRIYNISREQYYVETNNTATLGTLEQGELSNLLPAGYTQFYFWMYNPSSAQEGLRIEGTIDGQWKAAQDNVVLAPQAWTKVVVLDKTVEANKNATLYVYLNNSAVDGLKISPFYYEYVDAGATPVTTTLTFGEKTDNGETHKEYGKIYNISREQWYVDNNNNNTIGTLGKNSLANALPEGRENFYFWMYNGTGLEYNFHIAGDCSGAWTDSKDTFAMKAGEWTKITISNEDIQLNKQGQWYVYILGGDGQGAAKDGWKISDIYAGPAPTQSTTPEEPTFEYSDYARLKKALALIDAIPETVSISDKAAVEAARKAYDKLTNAQKASVANVSKLTAAEIKITDIETTEAVVKLIDSIKENNINASLVAQAREQYDMLSNEAKAAFDASKLQALERYEAVCEVNTMIAQIPNAINMPTDIYLIFAIQEAKTAYNALSYDCKELVSGYDKLTKALTAIADYETVYVPTAGTLTAISGSAPCKVMTVAATGEILQDEAYGTYFKATSGQGGNVNLQFNGLPALSSYEKIYFYVRSSVTGYLYVAEDTGEGGWGSHWANNYDADIGANSGRNQVLTANTWTLMEFSGQEAYFTANSIMAIWSGATDFTLEITSIIGYGKQAGPAIPEKVEVNLNLGQMSDTGTTNEYGKVYNLKQSQWFIDTNDGKTMADFQVNALANALPEGYASFEFYLYNPTNTVYTFHLAGGNNGWTDSVDYISLAAKAWTKVTISADDIEMNKEAAWYMYILGGDNQGAAQDGWQVSTVYAVLGAGSTQGSSKTATGLNFAVATDTGTTNEYGTVYNLTQASWVLGDGNEANDATDLGAFDQGTLRNALQGKQELLAFWIKNPNDRGVYMMMAGGTRTTWTTFTYALPANTWTLVRIESGVISMNDSYSVYVSVSYGADTAGWQMSPVYAYGHNDFVAEITAQAQGLIDALDENDINEGAVTAARRAYEALTETEKAYANNKNLVACETKLYGNVANAPFIENFESQYKIYYATGNKEAATFMQEQLAQATGMYLSMPIVSATPTNLTKYRYAIVLGYEDLAAELGLNCPTEEEIGVAGYSIQRIGRTVFILARGEDGYRMGMLAFLRETIGYDMISEDCIVYNTEKAASMPAFSLTEKPAFDYRQKQTAMSDKEVYGMGLQSHTDLWISAPNTRGAGNWDMHNVLDYLSYDDYKNAHPAWFYTKKDSGGTTRTQICPTAGGSSDKFNEMVNTIAANMLARLTEAQFDGVENICISTMDSAGGDYCTCTRCKLYNTLYGAGGFTAAWIDLMNAINAKIRETLPEGRKLNIAFLAYRDTETAPINDDLTFKKRYQINDNGSYTQTNEDLKCDEGVTVWLAPINAKFAENFNHADNAATLATIKKWCKLSDSVFLWMYGTNFKYFLYPYNTWQASAENYKILADLGVKGVWSQSIEKEGTAFTDLKAYIDSKFMFDVNANYEEVLNTYFTNYFGPAATQMRAMFDTLVAQCEALEESQSGLGRGIYDDYEYQTGWLTKKTKSYWSESNLNALLTLCNQAKDAINASSLTAVEKTTFLNRITKESLFPRYVLCQVYKTENLTTFKNDCAALGVTHYKEGEEFLISGL